MVYPNGKCQNQVSNCQDMSSPTSHLNMTTHQLQVFALNYYFDIRALAIYSI